MPHSSSTVPGLKFVDEQIPRDRKSSFWILLEKVMCPPVTAGTRAASHDAEFTGSADTPPLAAFDFPSRFEPHVC